MKLRELLDFGLNYRSIQNLPKMYRKVPLGLSCMLKSINEYGII